MSDQDQNPLEKIFDFPAGSTPVFNDINPSSTGQLNERATAIVDPTTGEIIERKSTPDDADLIKEERLEDLHIDGQLESVHNSAIVAFEKSARI